jgi:hypothetical protein
MIVVLRNWECCDLELERLLSLFGTEPLKTTKYGAYLSSIQFLPSDLEWMVDSGPRGKACLAYGKAPDPCPYGGVRTAAHEENLDQWHLVKHDREHVDYT